MARLVVVEGPETGMKFELDAESCIGRSPKNVVCIPDSRASREHARIMRYGTRYVIEDLNSANGTFLRGEQLAPGKPKGLEPGDDIWIGATRLVFESDTAATPSQAGGSRSSVHGFGNVSLMLMDEAPDTKGSSPEVNAVVDASMSMMEVGEKERSSQKGLQDALRRLQAMCQVSQVLGTIFEQGPLLERIIDLVFDLFPAADRAFILLRGHGGPEFVPVAARSRNAATQEEIAVSRTIINEVVSKRCSLLSSDAQSDSRFSNQMSIVNLSIRSMMCAPLIAQNEILGVLQVDSRSGGLSFTAEDLQVLTGISAQAAIAVKNAQLYEAVETETARRTSLQRYFSPNMVEMMMNGDVNTELGGNNYLGTVFFSDIIGFTAMSESMPAAQVVANLNRYFTIMQKLIYDNGGNVDKFGGDAIMAFWSVPHRQDEDERRAVLTGVQMQGKIWPFNLDLHAEGQRPIYMGIGLNTGEFVAGNIGSEDKIEFTLIGDNVNLAARIEARAGRHQVFISERTYEGIAAHAAVVKLPPVEMKGKSQPITVYSVRMLASGPGEYALAIPCRLVLPAGEFDGILTALSVEAAPVLELSTTAKLEPGTAVRIDLDVPEYHAALTLNATIANAMLAAHSGTTPYTNAQCMNLSGSGLELLTAGTCLKTSRGWDSISRK